MGDGGNRQDHANRETWVDRTGFRAPPVLDVMAVSRAGRAPPSFGTGGARRQKTRSADKAMSVLHLRSPASDFGAGASGASALAGAPMAFNSPTAPKYSK